MSIEFTQSDLLDHLRQCQGPKTLRVFAAEIGVSASYLCKMYSGKEGIGPKILDMFDFERVPSEPSYRKKRKKA